jgi:cell division transport system permease protein
MTDRSLHIFGIPSKKAAHFDLPLHARMGTEFLVLLIALMTFLSLIATSASLVLGDMAEKWTSGLENTITIEVPGTGNSVTEQSQRILKALKDVDGLRSAKLLGQGDIEELVSPWLGSAADSIGDLPLPALITIELKDRDADTLRNITATVTRINPEARVDAHEEWLSSLLRLTRSLEFGSLAIVILITLITALTVGGAVRSRMAIHHAELELLHIMGSDDAYISSQFRRYIAALAGRGAFVGTIASLAVLLGAHFLSGSAPETVPDIAPGITQIPFLLAVPAVIVLISLISAHFTALRVLREMP